MYCGEIYDERKRDPSTGKLHGWVLTAGDRIRYWGMTVLGKSNLIGTKITQTYDKYGTLKLLSAASPIEVEIDGNPPFWDTEIEKFPYNDKDPTFYALKQCKFIPGQVENKLLTEHIKCRKSFRKTLKDGGWGGMLYNDWTFLSVFD